MKKAGDDGYQNMGADMVFNNKEDELDFWHKFDKETETFTILFTAPSDPQMMKLYFSEELFLRFIRESLEFVISSTGEEDLDEDESKAA